MSNGKVEALTKEFEALPERMQDRIMSLVHKLNANFSRQKTAKKKIIDFAGTITKEDADNIEKAIYEECERIDINEW